MAGLAAGNPLFDELDVASKSPSPACELGLNSTKKRKLASSSPSASSVSSSPPSSYSASSSGASARGEAPPSSASAAAALEAAASSPPRASAADVVKEGQYVVLVCSLGRRFVVRVPLGDEAGDGEASDAQAAACVKQGVAERAARGCLSRWVSAASPFDFPLSLLPGHAFYSSFLCCRGIWSLETEQTRVDDLLAKADAAEASSADEEEGAGGSACEGGSKAKTGAQKASRMARNGHEEDIEGDNRDIADSNDAQHLTAGKIECLREEGLRGEEVIRLLMMNSTTFEKKTKFAKEKYIRKKMARHLKRVTVLPATVREVCEAYYATDATKIAHLRMDYLSSVLINANIKGGDRVLVFDHSMGLLSGAVARQLNGAGRVWRLTDRGTSDKLDAELNLAPAVRQTIFNVPLAAAESWLTKRERLVRAAVTPTAAKSESEASPASSPSAEEAASAGSSAASAASQVDAATLPAPLASNRFYRELDALHAGVDSAIFILGLKKMIRATPADALPALRQLAHRLLLLGFRLLKSEGRLVVFCHNWEVASSVHAAAGASREFVHVQMQEFMLREHQILPRRTHPVMNSSLPLFSGFVVSAIRMEPDA
ncbi:eukaryotic initiation factor 3, gamma subunit protein [Besnoitia besnoiti]|uniref:tRNA (adenine(58)-N(1))-methyltransferase non-catalytic subunit TRM6 n=1 Tax=Besnoitia besnoiti TaxID=94643 RepID=A0A2A9M4J8_BESBE|nr:eukaryotic initiation factor 3, gamma subunit protein [Besnoitia besnoiti]PFH31231.1 eukaryotic initiation factor 3, gamma subunit protein [Besnoitia besnoiti]